MTPYIVFQDKSTPKPIFFQMRAISLNTPSVLGRLAVDFSNRNESYATAVLLGICLHRGITRLANPPPPR